MNRNQRLSAGITLSMVGGGVLAFGILLVLIKLLITLAWHYAGAIVLAGLILLIIGFILRRI